MHLFHLLQFYSKFFPYNVNEDFLVRYFVGLGVSNTVGSGASSGAIPCVGILFGFFVGNLLLSKLFRIFSLELRNNSASLKKTFSQLVFYLSPYPLIH